MASSKLRHLLLAFVFVLVCGTYPALMWWLAHLFVVFVFGPDPIFGGFGSDYIKCTTAFVALIGSGAALLVLLS